MNGFPLFDKRKPTISAMVLIFPLLEPEQKEEKNTIKELAGCFLWMDGINEKSQIPLESGPYIEQTTEGGCVMMIWLVL